MSSRQLTAIMFADIMGYTALMQEDEANAIQVREKFSSVLSAEVTSHDGRIIKFMGDGALCVFNSTIEAVKAALAIQMQMLAAPQVPLRIGIHAGDVIFKGGEIYGDGVNIASRVESFAVPGGIFISGKVYDDIKNQNNIQTVSLGRYSLKNVKEPVEIFAISNQGLKLPGRDKIEGKGYISSSGKKPTGKFLWPALLLVIAVIAFLVYKKWGQASDDINKIKSIAVLPFRNESIEKEENEFFSNGMMQSVLNNLAQVEALRVISRQSVEQYRDSKKPIRDIARELGVAYILEGSVQRFGNQIKVIAQLIHAKDDRYLWSQEYPGELNDIFSLQSDIAQNIASKLSVSIKPDEKERIDRVPTRNIQAWNEYQKAYTSHIRFVFSLKRDNLNYKNIISLCDRALALDPQMAEAYTLKAQTYWAKNYDKNVHDANEEFLTVNFIDTVAFLCQKALTIDKNSADANTLFGLYYIKTGKVELGVPYLQQAIAVNPNHSEAFRQLGNVYLDKGENTKAFKYTQEAVKLDPFSIWAPFAYNNLAWIYITVGDFGKAEALLNKSLQMEKSSSATVEAFHRLAHAYTVEGNGAKMLETAEKWLQIDSTALRYIGEYYCTFKKDYSKSLFYFNELFRAKPHIAHSKQRWGLTLWLSGKKDSALILFNEQIQEFERLIRLGRTTTGTSDYDLAGIYTILGQKEKAYLYLKGFDKINWPWGSIYYIQHDPFFDSLRKEKEFNDIIQQALKEKEKQRKEMLQLEENGSIL